MTNLKKKSRLPLVIISVVGLLLAGGIPTAYAVANSEDSSNSEPDDQTSDEDQSLSDPLDDMPTMTDKEARAATAEYLAGELDISVDEAVELLRLGDESVPYQEEIEELIGDRWIQSRIQWVPTVELTISVSGTTPIPAADAIAESSPVTIHVEYLERLSADEAHEMVLEATEVWRASYPQILTVTIDDYDENRVLVTHAQGTSLSAEELLTLFPEFPTQDLELVVNEAQSDNHGAVRTSRGGLRLNITV